MKILKIPVLFLFAVAVNLIFAETPVLVADYQVDTSLYYYSMSTLFRYAPGPLLYGNMTGSPFCEDVLVMAFRKKNSNEIDIYSYTGKCGTSVFPQLPPHPESSPNYTVFLSQTYVDNDPQWEAILIFNREKRFLLLDHDGAELLRDSITDVGYGFDGNSTYIVAKNRESRWGFKTWRLRTNISSAASPSLGKKKAASPGTMVVHGLNDGNYRVTLTPSSGNGAIFQLHDLLGRCLLSKSIKDFNGPVTFTIPNEQVPKTPFIAETKSEGSALRKKVIPVK